MRATLMTCSIGAKTITSAGMPQPISLVKLVPNRKTYRSSSRLTLTWENSNAGHGFALQPELQNVVFNPSGLTGAELRQAAGERVRQWLDYRDASCLDDATNSS